jgi:hypothetical protein
MGPLQQRWGDPGRSSSWSCRHEPPRLRSRSWPPSRVLGWPA